MVIIIEFYIYLQNGYHKNSPITKNSNPTGENVPKYRKPGYESFEKTPLYIAVLTYLSFTF